MGSWSQLSRLEKTFVALAAFVFVFQCLTLNHPRINGDEAIYMLIVEEWAKLRSGHLPSVNPLIDYSGPLHFWLIGSVYGLTSAFSWLAPGAWMVRLPPFLLFWAGLLRTTVELGRSAGDRRDHRNSALWYLLIGAVMPLTVVFSRATFPESVLLGAAMLFMSEAVRLARTGEVRWLWAGVWAALTVDTHPTGFVAIAAIGLPVLPDVLREARKRPARALGCVSIFCLSAWSTVRNFPFPIEAPGKRSFFLQFRAIADMVTGIQTYDFWFARDLAPDALLVAVLLFLLFCFFNQLRECLRSKDPGDRFLLRVLAVHVGLTLLIAKMAMNGRPLFEKGCDRYLLCLVPGWIWLQSDALERFARAYLKTEFARAGLAVWVGAFFFLRPMLLTLDVMGDSDPCFLEMRWLSKECPRGKCVAYAEDFWDYWPIRFFGRDAVDLNFQVSNWKEVARHPTEGKEIAACWHEGSGWSTPEPGRASLEIAAQDYAPGERCKVGVRGLKFPQ